MKQYENRRGTFELQFDKKKRTAWNKGVKGWWSDEHRARVVEVARRANAGKSSSRRVPIVVEDTNGRRYFFPCITLAAAAIGRNRKMLHDVLAGKKRLGHELTGYRIFYVQKI